MSGSALPMDFELDDHGTLLRSNVGTTEVLFPVTEMDGGTRGGAPVCVPLFSHVPRSMVRPGLNMPIHGLAPQMNCANRRSDANSASVRLTHRADAYFEWDFSCDVIVAPTRDAAISHIVEVRRHPDCTQPAGMPLSVGWHPYFATDGADFTLRIDGWRLGRSNIERGNSLIFFSDTAEGTALPCVEITTARGRVLLNFPNAGYDRVCVWTDHAERYICVEPIFGYLRFGHPDWLLEPGETRRLACEIAFEPA